MLVYGINVAFLLLWVAITPINRFSDELDVTVRIAQDATWVSIVRDIGVFGEVKSKVQ